VRGATRASDDHRYLRDDGVGSPDITRGGPHRGSGGDEGRERTRNTRRRKGEDPWHDTNQRLLGVFKDRIEVDIEPHDTRVLHIHSLQGRPQLIGISRHISGAYSVLDLEWDSAQSILKGSSQTVPGDTYAMYVHVPDGLAVAKVEASAGARAVPAHWECAGHRLMVSLAGQQEPIDWKLTFTSGI